MKDNELVTYQVKVNKEKWKTFKVVIYFVYFVKLLKPFN